MRIRTHARRSITVFAALAALHAPAAGQAAQTDSIPLPEHPRPDWMRESWVNLNGTWQFQFDAADAGAAEGWQRGLPSPGEILVPFPWGSPLSGVPDDAQIGWYARGITVPADWRDETCSPVL